MYKSIKASLILCVLLSWNAFSQHELSFEVMVDESTQSLDVSQKIIYVNSSQDTLSEIRLLNWANSFSSKTTPLGERFNENFENSFHFELDKNRGRNIIESITNFKGDAFLWEFGKELDLIRLPLKQKLAPKDSLVINLKYNIKVPEDRFTRYGVSKNNDYKLRYWYIAPAVYRNHKWEDYSNKNVHDFFMEPSKFVINFHFPKEYQLVSDLDIDSQVTLSDKKIVRLVGDNRSQAPIYLDKTLGFRSVVTDQVEVLTDLRVRKVTPTVKALQIDRITQFLEEKLGPYPFKKLVISDADYRTSPVYGLNQLPDFISPFPNGFEMDMELLKTITRTYLKNTLAVNPREDFWLYGALQVYLMIEFVNEYYPNQKILGEISNYFIIRWSYASELEFNDQYPLLSLNAIRNNLQQPLNTPKDSLLKFNMQIGTEYHAGTGFQYLKDYIGSEPFNKSIKQYFESYLLQPSTPVDFKEILVLNTDKPIDWFFDNYVGSRKPIDFKIEAIEEVGDSLKVTVKNKRKNKMPVALYGLDKDKVRFKKWLPPFEDRITTTVPNDSLRKLSLDYEEKIPEINKRNNYKKVKGLFNRPLQFRIFKDLEDPKYNQLFMMPSYGFNIYDGLSIGAKFYNKTFLPKGLHYRLEPQYGLNSNTVVGSASINWTDRMEDGDLYQVRYGVAGTYRSYNTDLFFRRFSPFVIFAFRDHEDLRKNKKQFINVRNVTIDRDPDPNDPDQEPNYSVYNASYVYSDNNLIDFYRAKFDFQVSNRFSKLSTELEYRKLFLSNRQINVRFFAGIFLNNNTPRDDDFFSFALDRPTDYLFDYNYYGRSEDQGLFSQQLIIAEGGFKSQLQPAFANEWIMTTNVSTNIWKWIYLYGDAGWVKNRGQTANFVYDSGIRASLVMDYFELYFPLYSNLGWEPGLGNYDERIRFIVTLDLRTLFSLFTRKWY